MPKRHHHTESWLNNLSVNADPEHPVYREATTEIQKRLRYMVDYRDSKTIAIYG